MRCTRTRLCAAMVVVAVAATGCGGGPPGQDPQPTPAPSETAQASPPPAPLVADPARSAEDTMILVAETVLTMYPRSGEPGDSWWRADKVLSPEGHFPHRGEQVQVPRGRGEWFDWQSRGVEWVKAEATVTTDEHPPDTDTIAARVLEVRLTEHADNGSIRGVHTRTYYATVTRNSPADPWLLETLSQP